MAQLQAQQGILGGFENQNLAGISSGITGYNAGQQGLASGLSGLTNPTQGSMLGTAQGQAQQTMNNYQNVLGGLEANPGYTQAEQAGMKEAAVAPISSAYGSAQYANTAGAARTGNAGAATAANAELARSKAMDMSTALSGLQQNIGQARIAGTNEALSASALPGQYASSVLQGQQGNQNIAQGNQQLSQFPTTLQAGLYNTNLNAQQNTLSQYGQGVQGYLSQANQPGFLSGIGKTIAGGLAGGMSGGYSLPSLVGI